MTWGGVNQESCKNRENGLSIIPDWGNALGERGWVSGGLVRPEVQFLKKAKSSILGEGW